MTNSYLPINKITKFIKENTDEQNSIVLDKLDYISSKLDSIIIILIIGFTSIFTFVVLQNFNFIKLLNKN